MAAAFDLKQQVHRRYNALTAEWVLVSPHRTQRPWLGQVEKPPVQGLPAYDPGCYLCPGNERVGGIRNPDYAATFVFDNDFPALRALPAEADAAQAATDDDAELLVARPEAGICRVICFSPRHDLTIGQMAQADLHALVETWTDQVRSLAAVPWVRHIQVFENRGAIMGTSNPHPHCQVWATASLPNLPARELAAMRDYRARRGTCLLCDYLRLERERGERIVCENDAFTVVVPFWAMWPFETLLLPRRHVGGLEDLSADERDLLAAIIKDLVTRYDRLFDVPFPYSMGFHAHPYDRQPHPESHLHAHYYPPLLRSATVRKFMVGYEMLGEPQRDSTPETAAERLRLVG